MVVDTSNPIPEGPIIGGVIGGVIVLAILIAMLWFFYRRRRQLDLMVRSPPSNFDEKFGMNDSTYEVRTHSGGVFGPFGG